MMTDEELGRIAEGVLIRLAIDETSTRTEVYATAARAVRAALAAEHQAALDAARAEWLEQARQHMIRRHKFNCGYFDPEIPEPEDMQP